MTPVMFLSDGYLANGAEPWQIPDVDDAARHRGRPTAHRTERRFLPYKRDPRRSSRPWAIPGTPGLEHRIGGLEKEDVTGNVNYEPANHEHMAAPAPAEDRRHRRRHPAAGGRRAGRRATCWSSAGAAPTAPSAAPSSGCRRKGWSVAHAHLRYLNPLPQNIGDVLRSYKQVLVPELNLGQLSHAAARASSWSTPRASTRSRASRSAIIEIEAGGRRAARREVRHGR